MRKYGNEFKVGIFVILCISGLFYLMLRTGKLGLKKDGYYIEVVFDGVAGLEKKAPVMLNGLEVGRVDDIKISYNGEKTQIILKLWLERQAKIRENPVVSIKTLGLMGEKYIEIVSNQGKGFIKPGMRLQGKPYKDLDTLMEMAESVGDNVDALIDNVNNLTDEVEKLARNLNYTVEGNQDRITQIIKNLEATTKNFEEFSEDIKRHPWKLLFKQREKKPRKKRR